jgi:hypothetical protein
MRGGANGRGAPTFPRFGRGVGGPQQQHHRPFAPFGGIGLPGHPGLDLSKVKQKAKKFLTKFPFFSFLVLKKQMSHPSVSDPDQTLKVIPNPDTTSKVIPDPGKNLTF